LFFKFIWLAKSKTSTTTPAVFQDSMNQNPSSLCFPYVDAMVRKDFIFLAFLTNSIRNSMAKERNLIYTKLSLLIDNESIKSFSVRKLIKTKYSFPPQYLPLISC